MTDASPSPEDADLLLRFEDDREQVVEDLLRHAPAGLRTIVDLGCGPGTSTRKLIARYPHARITAVDISESMLAVAALRAPGAQFVRADLNEWRPSEPLDLVFADSALQWLGDHEALFSRLMGWLAPGGALAVQMPDNRQEPSHALMRMIAADGPWANRLVPVAKTRAVIADYNDYYRWLRPLSARLRIWQTAYIHPLDGVEGIVDWFRGSALRPFLAPLSPPEREDFLARYRRDLGASYSVEPDGPRAVRLSASFPARAQTWLSLRRRADHLLVERGLFASRARAQEAIAAGLVRADGEIVRKASQALDSDARLEGLPAHPWASRGGLKLIAALDVFGLDPSGLACLDLGASTGGFTDVLLARGAKSVVAVDVGHGQFSLSPDTRVRSLEGRDARSLKAADLFEPPQGIVCDVSFISQRLVLPHALALAAPRAWLASLVKPQFELGPGRVVKGKVKDEAALVEACENVRVTVEGLGWTVLGVTPSPVLGGEGAREFLLGARR